MGRSPLCAYSDRDPKSSPSPSVRTPSKSIYLDQEPGKNHLFKYLEQDCSGYLYKIRTMVTKYVHVQDTKDSDP